MRVDRTRKSAKTVIEEYATELLKRHQENDKTARSKLLALEVIALRMNWHPLYYLLRFRSGLHDAPAAEPAREERPEPWWNR